jgi:predicted secreted hydrolase
MFLPACFNSSGKAVQQKVAENKLLELRGVHFQHPLFLTEWWYVNGHIETKTGKSFAYGFCLFRASPLLYFAHLSLTDLESGEFSFDRVFYPAKKVIFNQKERTISYGDQQLMQQTGLHDFVITGEWKGIKIQLALKNARQPMLSNGNGKIDMPEGGLSYYYSLTRLHTVGWITAGKETYQVSGNSWLDHQWGNFYVRKKSWDWFSFQMDDSTDYNLYSFRDRNDKIARQYINVLDSSGQLYNSDRMLIKKTRMWKNVRTGRRYVTGWELILPERKDTFIVKARKEDQELFDMQGRDFFPSYWEGSCIVEKRSAGGKRVFGRGFSEHYPYSREDQLP